jgi:hypothetical protein
MMIKIDLYTGFELDNEMIFREKTLSNEIIIEVDLWYGYFDSIMDLIPPFEGMHPDSIVYNWEKSTGFYERGEWECKRVQEFYDQLVSGQAGVTSDFEEAYNALKQICLSTIQNGNKLYIEYN